MEPTIQVPPRTILLATDLTARSDRALARAQLLAKNWQSRLVAVHAVTQEDSASSRVLDEPLPQTAPDLLQEARERIRRDVMPAMVDSAIVVERGKPVEVISRTSKTQKCDLIVTGTGSDDTLSRMGLRRTRWPMVRRLGVPLLRVRQKADTPYRSILVGVDMTEASHRALQTASALFPEQSLNVLHAYEPPLPGSVIDDEQRREECRQAAMRECSQFISSGIGAGQVQRSFKLFVGNGWPSTLIHQHVVDHDIDLVVLGAHDRGSIFDILFGSTAVEALNSLPCDVLIVGRRGVVSKDVGKAA
jgi:nucleotide-binding universal stress UspA family protein